MCFLEKTPTNAYIIYLKSAIYIEFIILYFNISLKLQLYSGIIPYLLYIFRYNTIKTIYIV